MGRCLGFSFDLCMSLETLSPKEKFSSEEGKKNLPSLFFWLCKQTEREREIQQYVYVCIVI